MSTAVNWQTPAEGGYMYADELSDTLRMELQPLTKFRQLCEPDEEAIEKGLHRGEKYRWNVYGDLATQGRRLNELQPMPETNFQVSQSELTVMELGNSVPYTGKVTALARHDVLKIINKGLKNDARKAFDIEAWTQFNACKLRAAPAGGTSTVSVTVTENASTATTNNVSMGTGHVKAIVDNMRERNIPGYIDDDYVSIGHPTTYRPFKNELETLHQYTEMGLNKIFNGEVGRYEGCRFIEQNFIPKGGAIDSTTFDPYTQTGDAWNNGLSSWAFFMGGDTVNEAIVIPEEIRAKMPGDYGRSAGLAWYYLGGFGIVHDTAAQSRIMKWDSAA
jgi:N4-gp56 family major capsid protein